MIYALYISCIFAPFSTPIQCENSIFVCVRACCRIVVGSGLTVGHT